MTQGRTTISRTATIGEFAMKQGTIQSRLATAVREAGAQDVAGVLVHDDETMPLCDALRLAEVCGMSTEDLLG